jgi:hypothetical protein
MALNNNLQTAVSSITSEQIVSGFDLHKPTFLAQLKQRYGNQGLTFANTISSLGMEMNVSQFQYGHFEDDWVHGTFSVASAAAANPNGTVVYTLNANPNNAQAGYAGKQYLRPKDTVLFPDGSKGFVTAVGATSATITPFTGYTLPQTSAGWGTYSIITGNLNSEGSNQLTPRFSGTREYQNYLQILKEDVQATGSEMTNESWVSVYDGKNIQGYYNKVFSFDIDYRMAIQQSATFMFGEKVNAATIATANPDFVDPDNGLGAYGTQGFFPYMQAEGNIYTYTPGFFNSSDLDNFDRILQANYVGDTVIFGGGLPLFQEFQAKLQDQFKFTNIDYTQKEAIKFLFGDGKDGEALAAAVNFDSFKSAAGRTYLLKNIVEFTNPQLFGASGYGIPQYGFIIPIDKSFKNKKGNGEVIGNIGLRYKTYGSYSRKMEVFRQGSANMPIATNGYDWQQLSMRSQFGAHFAAGNQMIWITP